MVPRAGASEPGEAALASSRAAQLLSARRAVARAQPAGAALVPYRFPPARRPWYDASPLASRS